MNTKRILAAVLALMMVVSLCACGDTAAKNDVKTANETETKAAESKPVEDKKAETEETNVAEEKPKAAPEAKEVRGVTVPAFSVTVNGIAVDNDMMAAYPVYSVEVTTTNSSGTVSTTTYAGFAMKDVLEAAGLAEQYIWLEATADDGYAVTYTGDIFAATTLLAINKDGSQFKASPWFAPCASETTGDYLKSCVSILVNTEEGAPELKAPEKEEKKDEPAAGALELTGDTPDKQDKTDKVSFGDFSFKISGKDVTNQELEGLSIFKVTVVTENSKGTRSESTYTGYVLSDVLKACGYNEPASVKAVANDGYESELPTELIASEYTIVAIEKDKETGEGGTIWLAPCTETTSSSYCKNVVELVVD